MTESPESAAAAAAATTKQTGATIVEPESRSLEEGRFLRSTVFARREADRTIFSEGQGGAAEAAFAQTMRRNHTRRK